MAILAWMARRHRSKFAYLLVSLLLLPATLHSPTAYSAAGDPPSGSPAGAVYQLPLEQGRSDAAPKGSGGTGAVPSGGGGGNEGGGGGGAEPSDSGSLYRTENNFGSSSHVPGVASTGRGSDGAGGSGSAGAAAGTGAAIAGGAVAAETADTGNTSVTAGIVLIAAIALIAVAAGFLSRRFLANRAS